MFRLFALAVSLSLTACAGSDRASYEIKTSPYDVEETADRLEAAAEARGAIVFARIDHASGARGAGPSLEPTTVVIFGDPSLGGDFMTSQRLAAIDLPVRVLVFRENGRTRLAYLKPLALADRHGIENRDRAVREMTRALNELTNAVVARQDA